MAKLIKRFENNTDFDVCVWLVKSGKYVVTTYDIVNKTHEKQGSFDSSEEAIKSAEQINKGYIFENKQSIKLNESTLRKIVAESVKKVLKEEVDCESARKALSVFGIVPVDVEGGRMWLNQQNGQYYWSVSEALSELDLSYLDEKYTYNYGTN